MEKQSDFVWFSDRKKSPLFNWRFLDLGKLTPGAQNSQQKLIGDFLKFFFFVMQPLAC